jgi:hypothetical protein
MSSYNLSSSHPIIPNLQQYMLHYKFITINSDDRDIKKYPNSSEFEIELPQDYVNVQTVKLNSWSFPHKYDVFSESRNNTTLIFEVAPYYSASSVIYLAPSSTFTIQIEDGSYSPIQMATELTNKMNLVVTEYIKSINSLALNYVDFVVKYHEVNQKLWFGNNNSEFTLNNGSSVYADLLLASNTACSKRSNYTQYINWGLPYFLGFKQFDSTSIETTDKFYYLDNPEWLTKTAVGFTAAGPCVLKADCKTDLNGPSHFYMEISGMNNVDETMPMSSPKINETEFMSKLNTNDTNGIVNSCFAKIPVPTSPHTDWVNTQASSYMIYNPPAEKVRRLRIKIRYHNNAPVNFDNFEFSFMLQLGLFMSQNERKYNVYVPETVGNYF